MYNWRLCIFIEGDDDKHFFDKIIKPMLRAEYHPVSLWKYAKKKKSEVNKHLDIAKKQDADYIFVSDNDKLLCIAGRKEEIQEEFESIDDKGRIMLVIRKIESWYLAGLDNDTCRRLGFSPFQSTDRVGKGKFKESWRVKFDSRIDFMQEILKFFDIETAKKKNESFRYFVGKYDLQGIDGVGNST